MMQELVERVNTFQGELVKRSLHEAALQYCYYSGYAVNGEQDSGWGF